MFIEDEQKSVQGRHTQEKSPTFSLGSSGVLRNPAADKVSKDWLNLNRPSLPSVGHSVLRHRGTTCQHCSAPASHLNDTLHETID